MTIKFKFFFQLCFLAIFILLNNCSGFFKKVDARKIPQNAQERARQNVEEGRGGVIVSLLAILQLVKDSLIQLVQNEINGPIYIKAAS